MGFEGGVRHKNTDKQQMETEIYLFQAGDFEFYAIRRQGKAWMFQGGCGSFPVYEYSKRMELKKP